MVELLRHRQTKEAATDTFYLQPPRHISTLPKPALDGTSAFGDRLDLADPNADFRSWRKAAG